MTIDSEGFIAERPGAISTWTGAAIEPLDPDPADINIEDIAHALARLCRYNGHVAHFLSVARHSIWVSERVWERTHNPILALQGLLHDGAEAYLSDVPRPVKHQLKAFQAFDATMDRAVMEAFDLPRQLSQEVLEADRYVLLQVEMPAPAGARWTWNGVPAEDERDFLKMYHQWQDKIQRVGTERARPRLVGLAGYARSGKDTAYEELSRYGFKRIAFADRLKAIAAEIDPIIVAECGAPDLMGVSVCCGSERVSYFQALGADQDWLKEHTNYRVFLQDLGNSVREILGRDTWVKAALGSRSEGQPYAVTDVRYRNEIEAIKEAGGEVWWIERPGVGPANGHASENEIGPTDCDAIIRNDIDIPALKYKVGRTLEAL